MNLVLEGPDGAGKSTLANTLAIATGMQVVQGKGPPKSREEFELRTIDYLKYFGVIFDRHPCISEPIYAKAAGRECMLRQRELNAFHSTRPFIVYVRPTSTVLPVSHECKDHETPEHVAMVEQNHAQICALYDERMLGIAHYVHRRTDTSLVPIMRMASEFLCNSRQTLPGLFPSMETRPGDRWISERSLRTMIEILCKTLDGRYKSHVCNKCGFVGLSENGRHLRRDSYEVCNYNSVEVDSDLQDG